MRTLDDLLGLSSNFQGGPRPYQPQMPWEQPGPEALPAAPVMPPPFTLDDARRKMLMDAAWKMFTQEPPPPPSPRLNIAQAIAAGFQPDLLPGILESKEAPYRHDLYRRALKRQSLHDLLSLYPEQPDQMGIELQGGLINKRTGQWMIPPPKKYESYPPGHSIYEQGKFDAPVATVPGRAAGAETKIPASVHGRFLDYGINPLEPGEPGYEQYQAVLAARGKSADKDIQEEARKIYKEALTSGLAGWAGLPGGVTQETINEVAKSALAAMDTYLKQFAPKAAPTTATAAPAMTDQMKETYFRLRDRGLSPEAAERTARAMESSGSPVIP